MAKFVFQLEAVHRHRRNAEQERQRELADAQAEMVRLQTELKRLNDSVESGMDDLRTHGLVGTLDMRYIAAHRRFVLAVKQQAMAMVQAMARQQIKVDEARRNLAEAAKERKILDKLRERQFERWKAELTRKELEQLDEVGAQLGYRTLRDRDQEQQQEEMSP